MPATGAKIGRQGAGGGRRRQAITLFCVYLQRHQNRSIMKIISEKLIRSLGITPAECVRWIYDSFAMKGEAQLPAKISVHPADTDFFTSMPSKSSE